MPNSLDFCVISARSEAFSAAKMLAIGVAMPLLSIMALSVSAQTSGQQVYRGQSATGSASFSDRASPSNSSLSLPAGQASASAATPVTPAPKLPAALQQSVARYPVKFYSSPDCNACKIGRDWLTQRGIPFQEYRIASPEEQRTASNMGITTLPHLLIGTHALKGYDSLDWSHYLTAAGYPAHSLLPANYQAPPVLSVLPAGIASPASADAPGESSSGFSSAEPALPNPADSTNFRF